MRAASIRVEDDETQAVQGRSVMEAYRLWRDGANLSAEAICRDKLQERPNDAGALHLLGLIAQAQSRDDAAFHYLRCASCAPGAAGFMHESAAKVALAQGRCWEAVEAARRAIDADARRALAWHPLAVTLVQRQELLAARRLLERIVAAAPEAGEALNNLGTVLQRLGRPDLAAVRYRQSLERNGGNAEVHGNLAAALAMLGTYDDALREVRRAIALKPDFVNAYLHAALIETDRNRHEDALRWLDRVETLLPENVAPMILRAGILRKAERFEEGLTICRRAIALQPKCHEAYNVMGLLLQGLERDEEALAAFDRAIALAPESAIVLANKAVVLLQLARAEEADSLLERASALKPDAAAIWYTRATARQFHLDDSEIAAMERLLALPSVSYSDRLCLHFATGSAYLEQRDGERAFAHLNAGNRMKRAIVDYDADRAERRLSGIMRAFPAVEIAGAAEAGFASEAPIFVIGMPRTGTTLVEQILASHPRIHGAGELPDLERVVREWASRFGRDYPDFLTMLSESDYCEIGRDYMARVNIPAGALRFVDKMVNNTIYAGLIHKALPGARIIYCRRDPVDTCLSCYSKLFTTGLEYSYDLSELGRYYRAHDRLMRHWRAILPPETYLEIEYESVVADIETAARRLVSFCGLEWSPTCLGFHANRRPVRTASMVQVRRPIYGTSVGRSREFRRHLAPLIEALGEAPPAKA